MSLDKKIKDYQDLSEDGKFKIQVSLWRNQGLNADSKSLLTDLKLIESITENYTSMSEENKVVEYKSIYEIIDAYYNIRLDYYNKRKKYLINELTQKILELYSNQDLSKVNISDISAKAKINEILSSSFT